MSEQGWSVYILRCGDGTLYTGIARNLPRRIQQHASGTGAKYTKKRGPFDLVFHETFETRSAALIREAAIKKLSRAAKLKLAALYKSTLKT